LKPSGETKLSVRLLCRIPYIPIGWVVEKRNSCRKGRNFSPGKSCRKERKKQLYNEIDRLKVERDSLKKGITALFGNLSDLCHFCRNAVFSE